MPLKFNPNCCFSAYVCVWPREDNPTIRIETVVSVPTGNSCLPPLSLSLSDPHPSVTSPTGNAAHPALSWMAQGLADSLLFCCCSKRDTGPCREMTFCWRSLLSCSQCKDRKSKGAGWRIYFFPSGIYNRRIICLVPHSHLRSY